MNSPGGTQRRARVLPADERLDAGDRRRCELDDRLVVQEQLAAARCARRRSASSSSRLEGRGVHARARRARSGRLPSALAGYIATSASRSSSSAPLGARWRCRCSRRPPTSLAADARTAAQRREQPLGDRHGLGAVRRRPRAGRRTRRRPGGRAVSAGAQQRAQPARRRAISSSSPAAWPSLSLTALKSSRSRNSTATACPAPRSGRARASSRSRNSARLAARSAGRAAPGAPPRAAAGVGERQRRVLGERAQHVALGLRVRAAVGARRPPPGRRPADVRSCSAADSDRRAVGRRPGPRREPAAEAHAGAPRRPAASAAPRAIALSVSGRSSQSTDRPLDLRQPLEQRLALALVLEHGERRAARATSTRPIARSSDISSRVNSSPGSRATSSTPRRRPPGRRAILHAPTPGHVERAARARRPRRARRAARASRGQPIEAPATTPYHEQAPQLRASSASAARSTPAPGTTAASSGAAETAATNSASCCVAQFAPAIYLLSPRPARRVSGCGTRRRHACGRSRRTCRSLPPGRRSAWARTRSTWRPSSPLELRTLPTSDAVEDDEPERRLATQSSSTASAPGRVGGMQNGPPRHPPSRQARARPRGTLGDRLELACREIGPGDEADLLLAAAASHEPQRMGQGEARRRRTGSVRAASGAPIRSR